MLLSATGLIGILVLNLWHSATTAQGRAELDARRQANFTAASLRGLLRSRRFLDAVPAVTRFELRDHEVVVPIEVAWIDPPRLSVFEDLDVLVRDKLARIGQTAKRAMPLSDARSLLTRLIGEASSPVPHRDWLLAHAAWHAHRHDLFSWRDELLRELDVSQGGDAPAATLLLHATANRRIPDWGMARIAILPEPMARSLIDRLREKELDVDVIEARLDRVVAFRRTLRAVRDSVASLRDIPSPAVRLVNGHVLLFHGDSPGRGDGTGARLTAGQIEQLVRAVEDEAWAALPTGAHLSLTRDESETTFAVIPGLLAVAPREPERDAIDGPWLLGVVVVGLSLFAGAGLWLLLRSLRREAEAARTRSEFLTMVTHELKTPLAGIRLLAEMLKDGHVNGVEQHADYYRRLTSESVRLSMLIENVLDLGRIERGERAYSLRPIDLGQFVSEAAHLFEPIAGRDGIELRVAIEPSGSPVRADHNAMLQALLNVLDNARKYAGDGLFVDLGVEGTTITVRDFGPGIPASERSTVFERFERGARHRDGSVPGVGLGLYLARTIMRSHGGDLEAVEPIDGGAGVCFRFTLPVSEGVAVQRGTSVADDDVAERIRSYRTEEEEDHPCAS